MSKNTKKDFIYSKNPKNSMRVEKQKKPKKNKTAMIILWLLFAFWTLGSVLSLFNFSKNLIEVKADSVTKLYTFEGSNMTVYGSLFDLYYVNPNNSQNYMPTSDLSNGVKDNYYPIFDNENCLVNYRFSLSDVNYTSDSGASFSTELIFTASYNQFSSNMLNCYAYGSNSYKPSYVDETTDNTYSIVLGNRDLISYYMVDSNSGYNQFLRITRSSFDFTCDIVRVDMGFYRDKLAPAYHIVGGAFHDTSDFYFNFIKYFDSQDNYLEIAIPVIASNVLNFYKDSLLSNRSYLLSSNISNSTIYNAAWQVGYDKGFFEGIPIGYDEGYASGVNSGYQEGFTAGVLDSDKYTWLGLMTTVIESPVRALLGVKDDFGEYEYGLFSIEILGVNMSNFFAGILTLALLISLVRLILSRG